jgi:hypothetical protein
MKKLVTLLMVMIIAGLAVADPVQMYLDTAPNGGSLFAAFRTAAQDSIYNGTFVNQANSFDAANAGTLNYEDEDYMVYSFGDLGKRLHSFYYIPGETTSSLAGRFEVSIEYAWDGVWYNPYEAYGWGQWTVPGSWVNYDGNGDGITDGVMGSMGNANWGAYDFTTDTPEARAALAADLADSRMYLGNTKFLAKLDGVVYELEAIHSPIPEPLTMLLISLGGLALRKRS